MHKDVRNKPQASPQMPRPDGKTGSILTLLEPCVPGFSRSLPQRAETHVLLSAEQRRRNSKTATPRV